MRSPNRGADGQEKQLLHTEHTQQDRFVHVMPTLEHQQLYLKIDTQIK